MDIHFGIQTDILIDIHLDIHEQGAVVLAFLHAEKSNENVKSKARPWSMRKFSKKEEKKTMMVPGWAGAPAWA